MLPSGMDDTSVARLFAYSCAVTPGVVSSAARSCTVIATGFNVLPLPTSSSEGCRAHVLCSPCFAHDERGVISFRECIVSVQYIRYLQVSIRKGVAYFRVRGRRWLPSDCPAPDLSAPGEDTSEKARPSRHRNYLRRTPVSSPCMPARSVPFL